MAPDNPLKSLKTVRSLLKRRLFILSAGLLICATVIAIRLIDLTLLRCDFLRAQGEVRTLRILALPAHRGIIRDRNGTLLAISTPVTSVWVDPHTFQPEPKRLRQLALLIGLQPHAIQRRLAHATTPSFVYLKRALPLPLRARLEHLEIPGLFLQTEYHRYYPQGPVTAHVLGLADIDEQGQEGLELAYNHWLAGKSGLKKVIRDRRGHVVEELDLIRPPQPGHDLNLSLDQRLQYLAFQELGAGIQRYRARAGSVVVLDVETGEILAMTNWPSYDPNKRPTPVDSRYRNRAVTDTFEPGSTLKAFSMATVLASGRFALSSRVNTAPGWMQVSGHRVRDGRNYGMLDLTGILRVSSNVGMSRLALSLPAETLWTQLLTLGFGQTTGSGFPGERSGYLPHFASWNPFVMATLSFGYGLSATLLQLTQAYATLAHDGVRLPISFLKQTTSPQGQRVLPSWVAQTLLTMLESVSTRSGTAPEARAPGYRVTGKSGTTLIVGAKGYEHRYNSFFIGIAPASRPRLVVAVLLHDLAGSHYAGGDVAAHLFSRVMGGALRVLNVAPDSTSA